MVFSNGVWDQAGLSDYCVVNAKHNGFSSRRVVFRGMRFRGYRKAALGLTFDTRPWKQDWLDFVGCVFELRRSLRDGGRGQGPP